jgi:hypothetical protein
MSFREMVVIETFKIEPIDSCGLEKLQIKYYDEAGVEWFGNLFSDEHDLNVVDVGYRFMA